MRRRKWTLTVPKCFQCKWQKICELEEIDRRSEACLWFHYSYNTVAQYDDQWLDWDDPTAVGFARCYDCGTQMTLSQYDAGPYLCALCGKEMSVGTDEEPPDIDPSDGTVYKLVPKTELEGDVKVVYDDTKEEASEDH